MFTFIMFVIVLSILVFVHELGHFVTARKFGVRAEEFGFGYPPRAFGFYRKKDGKWQKVFGNKDIDDASDTIYSINWIPVGGFVKIKGENGDDTSETDSFAGKKIWQRTIILSAGVIMNIVLAAILISIGLMIGMPQSIENVSSRAHISDKKVQIVGVYPESPAEKAGIKLGDVVLMVDDKAINTDKELVEYINGKEGQDLAYKVKRNQDIMNIVVTPEIRKETGRAGVGISITTSAFVKYPWYVAIWEGIRMTFLITVAIIIAFYNLLKNLIIGAGLTVDLSGPVDIATMTGQAARMGIAYLIQFTAILSINLAILNFLPIPALDGGRIFFLIIEKIKGSPVRRELEAVIHNVGFLVLMALVILVTFRDVFKIFN